MKIKGNKIKTITHCEECKNPFQIPIGTTVSICPTCLAHRQGNDIEKVANKIKDSVPFRKEIEFNLNSKDQKLVAVRAQGEVFASKGGVNLMITEFVENSFDAIKKRKILEALPQALEQLQLTSELKIIMLDKYKLPITEFEQKYKKLNNDYYTHYPKLQKQILKVIRSKKHQKEYIVIELDDEKQEVRIIDSGTGIEYPIHICEHPFVSLKTGEDFSTGKFGRGSQVFREFCKLMEFISIRDKVSKSEEKEIISYNQSKKITLTSISIKFPADFPGGHYELDTSHEHTFKKLSHGNKIGTVVILKNWKQNYYEELSKNILKLQRRLIHHFGFAIDDIYNIGLKLIHNTKKFEVSAKNYTNDKINGLFDLQPIPLQTDNGKLLGTVNFFIYKTTRSYSDPYKKPFLVINGRPLGDTSISEIPRLSEHNAEIWQSHTITGYIVCDAVEPNQMRIGLADSDAVIPFLRAMNAASIDLKKLNTIWKNELSDASDNEMRHDVIDTVTDFLSKKGIKFNFKSPLEKGIQKDSKRQGKEITDEKFSSPGNDGDGYVKDSKGDTINIGYRKNSQEPTNKPGNLPRDDLIIVPRGDNKKEGGKIITVKIKRSLISKGGKRRRKSYTGPDLDFTIDEDCGDELSYFELSPPTVMIQSQHPAWKRLLKKTKNQTNHDKIEKEKKNYLLERYLWEIINNNAVQKNDMLSAVDRKNLFWTYYHDLIDNK